MPDNRSIRIAVTVAVVLLSNLPVLAAPPRVTVNKGCLWLTDAQGRRTQLTAGGPDRAPVLSPDGQFVAFLRKSENPADHPVYDYADGDPAGLADQVWLMDLTTKAARLLVRDRPANSALGVTENCQQSVTYIDDDTLSFSPDGDYLYFVTTAWVTTGALHRVEVATGQESFLMAANSVEVMPTGIYQGHLIVQQHRCCLGGGSYDWYWLYAPDGQEIGAVGETEEQVAEFKRIYGK